MAAALAPASHAEWGGRTTTPSGERVTVFVSDAYRQDPAFLARWTAFLGSLVHGPELSTVTVRISSRAEIARQCGSGAYACYSARQRTIVAPGDNVPNGPTAEAVLAHEYGHHVAASALNPPWPAVWYGTKRWASYQQICSGVRSRRLFPGPDWDPVRYRLDPAEAFAEAYRTLNERRLGLPETPWRVVSETLYPDDTALALLEQDVREPWRGPTTSSGAGSFARAGRATRTHAISTPLDGTLEVTVRAPASLRLRVELLADGGARVAASTTRGGARTLHTVLCGSRAHRLRVTRVAGHGAYTLTISKP